MYQMTGWVKLSIIMVILRLITIELIILLTGLNNLLSLI